MADKETKVHYKRAFFGYLWAILTPFFQMLIVGMIFSYFIKIPDYFAFLYSGLLLWNFVSTSIVRSTGSIVNDRDLIQKAKFPIESIPIAIVLSNFFQMLLSLLLFLIVIYVFGLLNFGSLWITLLCLVWLLLIVLGFSLLLSGLNVRFRDINFIVQTVILFWFYVTPILYGLNLIDPKVRILFSLNPLTSVFEMFKFSLIGQGSFDTNIFLVNLFLSFLILLVGIFTFAKEKKYFVDSL